MSHTDPNATSQAADLRRRQLRWLGWTARLDGQFTHEWSATESHQAQGRAREFRSAEVENRPWWDAPAATRLVAERADDAQYEAHASPVGWALHSRPLPGRDPSRIRYLSHDCGEAGDPVAVAVCPSCWDEADERQAIRSSFLTGGLTVAQDTRESRWDESR